MARDWSPAGPEATSNAALPLVGAIASYPVLESLVSHLRPRDLVTFTTVCQTVNSQIRMHEAKVKANLLSKTLCSGVGVELREELVCPCRTPGWHKYIGCAGEGYDAKSKPCVECGINTCDECRIHVAYQVFMEDPGLDDRRWWAGYLFGFAIPVALYPPLGPDKAGWHLPADEMRSHHDQGRLHIPLHINAIADPEPLHRLLDTDLGRHILAPWGRTTDPFKGRQVIGILSMVAQSRRKIVCLSCSDSIHEKSPKDPCSCTLRKRFLDRWVCVACHLAEWDRSCSEDDGSGSPTCCHCGDDIDGEEFCALTCSWCDGAINGQDDAEDEDEEKEYVDNDDEDENAGPAPPNLPVGALAHVTNKDGSRVSGERLGRSLMVSWAQKNGADLPCTCCKCPVALCEHHRHEMKGEDDSTDENEDDESAEDDEDGGDEESEDGDDDFFGAIDFDEDDENDMAYDDDGANVIDFENGIEPDVFEDSAEE